MGMGQNLVVNRNWITGILVPMFPFTDRASHFGVSLVLTPQPFPWMAAKSRNRRNHEMKPWLKDTSWFVTEMEKGRRGPGIVLAER